MNKKTECVNVDAKKETGTAEGANTFDVVGAFQYVLDALLHKDYDVAVSSCEAYMVQAKTFKASASEPVIKLLKNTRVAPDGKRWNNLYLQVRNGSPISIDLVGKTRSNWKIRNLLLAHATEFTPTWAYKAPECESALPVVDEDENGGGK